MSADPASPTFSSLLSADAPKAAAGTPTPPAAPPATAGSQPQLSEVKLESAAELKQALTATSDAAVGRSQVHAFELDVSTVHPDHDEHPQHHKLPWKHLLLASVLFVIGIGCTIAGISYVVHSRDGGFPLLIVGGIVLIPSTYQLYHIFQAYRRQPGFSFGNLPEYE